MNQALEDLLREANPVTPLDWSNTVREIVQEIALIGLWRSGFFEHAAFYGGTALRIFHGLQRFSEDLNFTLLNEASTLRLKTNLAAIETELAAWGFTFRAEAKSAGDRTGIESAFLKGNTRSIGVPDALSRHFPKNQRFIIKLELDTTPPDAATTEVKTRLLPTPFQVRLYDLPSLMAGKLDALLFRDWKNRVKGRDFYDFVWYASRDIPVNLHHLEARIRQRGNLTAEPLNLALLKQLLTERIRRVRLADAAEEVRPFLRDPRETALWSEAFFLELISKLKVQ
jgi:predicted nucleotidyltransferase component of viral defense system